jgi:hypothetical protein
MVLLLMEARCEGRLLIEVLHEAGRRSGGLARKLLIRGGRNIFAAGDRDWE